MGTGEWLTRGTVWLALALFVASEVVNARRRDGAVSIPAQWLNRFGFTAFLAHVVCAFSFYHGWSHSAALADTARQTAALFGWTSGSGLYVNYLFGLVWLGEVVWAAASPHSHLARAPWMTWVVRAIFFFMILNGAVVFARGGVRWLGWALCLTLAGCWFLSPRTLRRLLRFRGSTRERSLVANVDFKSRSCSSVSGTMTKTKLRWGILSTAQIARKNWKAIRNTGNSTVVAVASREVERSRQFIAACQAHAPMETVPHALGSYEALLASREVDAVYIPLPTGLRKEWVLRAAEAGKHIVCEKPCATSVADLREMLEACRRHRVQFMDGVMFMHSRRLDQMRAVLDDGASVGGVKRITSTFSFRAPAEFFTGNIRANSVLEPYGCLGDLGWYCLRFALWVMRGQLPRRVTGRILEERAGRNSPVPVPVEFSGELLFDHGVSSGFHCSFVTHNEQWANISGTQGYLQVPDFVIPFFGNEMTFRVNNALHEVGGCDFNMEAHWRRFPVPEYSNSHPTAQETNLFRNFADQVRSGSLTETWPDFALKTQQMMNACFESARSESRPVEPG